MGEQYSELRLVVVVVDTRSQEEIVADANLWMELPEEELRQREEQERIGYEYVLYKEGMDQPDYRSDKEKILDANLHVNDDYWDIVYGEVGITLRYEHIDPVQSWCDVVSLRGNK